MVRIFIPIVITVLGAAGCRSDPGAPPTERPDDPVAGDVVARVGGHSIGASEVESRMAAEELGAQSALEQLIDEALLVQEAERLGFTEDRNDERAIERLMVRGMLHDLEEQNTPESISKEDLREAYALHTRSFRVPERRRSWHILVEEQGDAGEALAKSILRELRQADDPRAVYERYANGGPQDLKLVVKAEDLPAMQRTANLEKPYKTALFEAESEGPLRNVVKTSYGWHAIVVAEILQEEVRTLEETEGEIREQLSQARRLAEIVAIVQGLEAQGLVRYDERGVQRLLSMPGLPERAK